MTATITRSWPVAIRLPPEARERYRRQHIGESAGLRRDIDRYEAIIEQESLSLYTLNVDRRLLIELVTHPDRRAITQIAAFRLRSLTLAQMYALLDAIESARALVAEGSTPFDALRDMGITEKGRR